MIKNLAQFLAEMLHAALVALCPCDAHEVA